MNILIAGDSFATKSSTCNSSWMELLAEQHQVTNLAQAGIGEYKIYKQLCSVDVNEFDLVIVSHTSPSRIHTNNHPIHKAGFHKDCDLILTDLIEHFQPFNTSLQTAKNFFKYHYDEEYQIDIYNLLRRQINDMILVPYISLSHIEIVNQLAIEKHNINLSPLWVGERGKINHYTRLGNRFVFKRIEDEIKKTS
jgi:hypothetical protein